ncbi:unnamed protein product, partial [Iphiclides podalirius]
METDEDSDRPVFMPRKSLARIPPRSHEEVTKTSACTSGGLKRTLQSPEEVGTALQKPRMELRMCRPTTPAPTPPIGATSSGGAPIPDTQGTHGQALDTGLEKSSKMELLNMARNNMQAIMGIVTGPQLRLNKNDTNAVVAHIHEVLAVFAALNIRLSNVGEVIKARS